MNTGASGIPPVGRHDRCPRLLVEPATTVRLASENPRRAEQGEESNEQMRRQHDEALCRPVVCPNEGGTRTSGDEERNTKDTKKANGLGLIPDRSPLHPQSLRVKPRSRNDQRSLCRPVDRERRPELVFAFPELDRGAGPREHDVFVLDVLGKNLSGVEVLDDLAADH